MAEKKDWHDSVTKFGFPYSKKETKAHIKNAIIGFAVTIATTAILFMWLFSGNRGVVSAMIIGFCGIEFIIGVFVVLCT